MRKNLLFAVFVFLTAIGGAFSWTDGELLVWTTDNRGFRALAELGKKIRGGDGGSCQGGDPGGDHGKIPGGPLRQAKALTSSSGRTTESENGPMRAY